MILSKLLRLLACVLGIFSLTNAAVSPPKRYQALWDKFDPKEDFDKEEFMYAVHDFVKDKTDEETYIVDDTLPLEI